MTSKASEDRFSVATYVHNCLISFQNACDNMGKAEPRIKHKLTPGIINDEQGRFRLWSGNVGAHRGGKGSLDYKLREASHIRDRVIELLQNLDSIIQDAIGIITGQRAPWEDMSDSDSDVSESGSQHDDEEATTELEQLASNMAEINTCLMRLSMAIRNPAPHDQFKDSTEIDTTHFESFDSDHVRGKFPMAKQYLVVRLGKAISRRRHYLRYREEHRKKLEQGLKVQSQPTEIITPIVVSLTVIAPSEKIESTVASSLPLAIKSSVSVTELDENDCYEDTLSQTSYASSTHDASRLRPPPLPEQGQDGDPFECPLCFRFTSVKQVAAWHKHVYRDLQPYVCTFEDCEIPDRTYESRHEWFHHEMQVHRKWWECVDGCNQSFRSSDSLREHLWDAHADITTEDRINDFVQNCERHDILADSAECYLCQQKLSSLKLLRRHLGKHHEELSLFALPAHMKDDHDESKEEEQDNESRSPSSSVQEQDIRQPLFDDDAEEKLEVSSQVSSSNSSTLDVLRCDFGDCVFECEGQLRSFLLAKHREVQHQGPDVFPCQDRSCTRWFYNDDERLVHHERNHLSTNTLEVYTGPASSDGVGPVTLSGIDDYFDRLAKFTEETDGPKDIDRLEFTIDGRTVSIYEVRRAIQAIGGHEQVRKKDAWSRAGRELPHKIDLTWKAANDLKNIYTIYMMPFDDYLERQVSVPTTDGIEPPLSTSSAQSAPNSSEAFLVDFLLDPKVIHRSIPTPGVCKFLDDEIQYSSLLSSDDLRIPILRLRPFKNLGADRTIFKGNIWEVVLGGTRKMVARDAEFTLRFHLIATHPVFCHILENKLVQVERSYLERQKVREAAPVSSRISESFDSGVPDTNLRIPLTDIEELEEKAPSKTTAGVSDAPFEIIVEGLTTVESIHAIIKFQDRDVRLSDVNSPDLWFIRGEDFEACRTAGDSVELTVSKIFRPGSSEPVVELVDLLLTPRDSNQTAIIAGLLQWNMRHHDSLASQNPIGLIDKTAGAAYEIGRNLLDSDSDSPNREYSSQSQHDNKDSTTEPPSSGTIPAVEPRLQYPPSSISTKHPAQFHAHGEFDSAWQRGEMSLLSDCLQLNMEQNSTSWNVYYEDIHSSMFFGAESIFTFKAFVVSSRTDSFNTRTWEGEISVEVDNVSAIEEVKKVFREHQRERNDEEATEIATGVSEGLTSSPTGLETPNSPESSSKTLDQAQSPVDSPVAGIATGNTLATMTPPPLDAQPGSKWAPWMRLTEYELAVLRKRMKKNAVWTPSMTVINRELKHKHRSRTDYEREKVRCEKTGENMIDEDKPETQNRIMKTAPLSPSTAEFLEKGRLGKVGGIADLPHSDVPSLKTDPKKKDTMQVVTQDGTAVVESTGPKGTLDSRYLEDVYPPDIKWVDPRGFLVTIHDDNKFVSEQTFMFIQQSCVRFELRDRDELWFLYHKNIQYITITDYLIELEGAASRGSSDPAQQQSELWSACLSITPASESIEDIVSQFRKHGVAFKDYRLGTQELNQLPLPLVQDKPALTPGLPLRSDSDGHVTALVVINGVSDGWNHASFEENAINFQSLDSKWQNISYTTVSGLTQYGPDVHFNGRLQSAQYDPDADGFPREPGSVQLTFRGFSEAESFTTTLRKNMDSSIKPDEEHLGKLSEQDAQLDVQQEQPTKVASEEGVQLRVDRAADIRRRCEQLDPPIHGFHLLDMVSFQEATKIAEPMNDHVWDVLRPRLLAEVSAMRASAAQDILRYTRDRSSEIGIMDRMLTTTDMPDTGAPEDEGRKKLKQDSVSSSINVARPERDPNIPDLDTSSSTSLEPGKLTPDPTVKGSKIAGSTKDEIESPVLDEVRKNSQHGADTELSPRQLNLSCPPDGTPMLRAVNRVVQYNCVFWHLGCPYSSSDKGFWETHSLTHIANISTPGISHCPVCDIRFRDESLTDDTHSAWKKKLEHLISTHVMSDGRLDTAAMLDEDLFNYLWLMKLIKEEERDEMNKGHRILREKHVERAKKLDDGQQREATPSEALDLMSEVESQQRASSRGTKGEHIEGSDETLDAEGKGKEIYEEERDSGSAKSSILSLGHMQVCLVCHHRHSPIIVVVPADLTETRVQCEQCKHEWTNAFISFT